MSVSEVRAEEGAVLARGMGKSVETSELLGDECDETESGASVVKSDGRSADSAGGGSCS